MTDVTKKAKETAARIMQVIEPSSPFITKEVIQGWIETGILTAYFDGKQSVHQDHQRYAIEKFLKAPKK